MAGKSKIPKSKRAAVVKALRSGKTRHATAKELGVPKSTVQDVAKAEGIAARPSAKAQTAAARDFNETAQVELLNRIASKAGELLEGVDKPGALRDLAVSAAILTDKRRLIDGKATERTETNAVSELARRISSIAERKRAGGGSGGSDTGPG